LAYEVPLEYRLGRATRILMSAIGYLFTGGGIALNTASFVVRSSRDSPTGMLLAGAVFLLLGVYALVSVARVRVILHADAIEVHRTFTTKRLARTEITGRRGNPVRVLLHHGKFLPLMLPDEIRTDANFDAWMAGIADLDQQEAQASLDAFLKDDTVAGSSEERLHHLNSARRVASFLAWISLAAFAWGIFYPHPYEWALSLLAVLPWVAVILAAADGAVYRLDRKQNEVTADLSGPLLMPGFALACRAVFDVEVFDWAKVIWQTAGFTMGFVLLTVIFVGELRTRASALVLHFLFTLIYAFGVVMLGNQQLDTSDPKRYRVQVVEARISTGNHTSYFLKLAPWGPRSHAEEVSVGRPLYERTAKGDTVCVYLYRGALRARWFVVSDCP